MDTHEGTADKAMSEQEIRVVSTIENEVPATSDPVVVNDDAASPDITTSVATTDEEQQSQAHHKEEETSCQEMNAVVETSRSNGAVTGAADEPAVVVSETEFDGGDEGDHLVDNGTDEEAAKKKSSVGSHLSPSETGSVEKVETMSNNGRPNYELCSSENKTSNEIACLEKAQEKVVSVTLGDETKRPTDLCASAQSEPVSVSSSAMAMSTIGPSQSNEKQDRKPPPKEQLLGMQEGKTQGLEVPSTPPKLSKPHLKEPPSALLVSDTPNTVVSAMTTASSATKDISMRSSTSLRPNSGSLVAAKYAIANGRSARFSSDGATAPASRETDSSTIVNDEANIDSNLRSTTASFVRAKQAIASGRAPLEEDSLVAVGTNTTTTSQVETAVPIEPAQQPGAVSVQPTIYDKDEESTDGKDVTYTDDVEQSKEAPVLLEAMLVPPSTELEVEEAVERAPVHSAMIVESSGPRFAVRGSWCGEHLHEWSRRAQP